MNTSNYPAKSLSEAFLGRCLTSRSDSGLFRREYLQSSACLWTMSVIPLKRTRTYEAVLAAQAGYPVQNLEPVLRACPELQKLNLASCALLGQSALDALLPAGAGSFQCHGRQQASEHLLTVNSWTAKNALGLEPWSCPLITADVTVCHCLSAGLPTFSETSVVVSLVRDQS